MPENDGEKLGPIRNAVAAVGASIIYLLIGIFGRKVRADTVPWLHGPIGGAYIGDKPYEECATQEGLSVERNAAQGGLVSDFDALGSDTFDVARVHPRVRHFYEHTSRYRMDVWAQSWFPASIGLWLLVTTISRKVNQLNFPLRILETAKGMVSEIVLLRDRDGITRYAGWYRKLVDTGRVIYTGFYMVGHTPHGDKPAVKVVFPMPNGNATVILRPGLDRDGNFELSSAGQAFGDVGFYRIHARRGGVLRVWRIRTLKEHFKVYVDEAGDLRCDHQVRFLGMPVLHLHYRIEAMTRETPA